MSQRRASCTIEVQRTSKSKPRKFSLSTTTITPTIEHSSPSPPTSKPTPKPYPSTIALVIIDIQNEFFSPLGNFTVPDACSSVLVPKLQSLIPRFRRAGGQIIWVQAIYENRIQEPPSMTKHPKGDGIVANNAWLTGATHVYPIPCCEAGTLGAEIYPPIFSLAKEEDEIVVKTGYSAFWETEALENVLREKGVTDVYYCGVATGTCVLATVIDTIERFGEGVRVHAVRDCMGWRREDTHWEGIRRMADLGIDLVGSGEVC